LASTFTGSIGTKTFGEKGVWVYPETAQIFKVPPVISGMGNATKFEFCTHVHRIDRNINPLKISGKVAVGVLKDCQKFSGHIYVRATGRIARSSFW